MDSITKDESGITALETAIILIAFVVVAAVFAFTILQAGTFSAAQRNEAYRNDTSPPLEVLGAIKAQKTTVATTVTTLTFELQPIADGAEGNVAKTALHKDSIVISYGDSDEYAEKLNWSVDWIVREDDDNLLEPNEIGQIAINLPAANGITLGPGEEFVLVIKLPDGKKIPILRTTPASLDNLMFLNH